MRSKNFQQKTKYFFALIAVSFTLFVNLQTVWAGSVEKQLLGLEVILAELETHYGMSQFKEEYFGTTIEKVRQKYSSLIKEKMTLQESLGLVPKVTRSELSDEDFEQLLIGVAAEFRDGHYNILRSTTFNYWTVGIYAAEVEGKYLVTGFNSQFYIKGAALPEPEENDEIVAINGESVEDLAQRIEPGVSLATYNSKLNYAYRFLLNRPHRWVTGVNAGDEVRIKFRRKNPSYSPAAKKTDEKADAENKDPEFLEFEGLYHWINQNDYRLALGMFPFEGPAVKSDKYVFGFSDVKTYFSEGLTKLKDSVNIIKYDALFNLQIENAKKSKRESEEDKKEGKETKDEEVFADSKERREQLSNLEKITSLPVYIVRYENKNIAVLRIPDYGFHRREVRWLGALMEELNSVADVLIIDQLGNGGGFVWTGSQTARLFAHEKEFQAQTIDMRLSQTLLHNIEIWTSGIEKPKKDSDHEVNHSNSKLENPDEDLLPNPNFAQLYLDRKSLDHLKSKFEKGEKFSGPLPYFGLQPKFTKDEPGRIVGREGHLFEKPILILNDSHSASCGDFFPSIMQANERALIMGETSMGLGGPVYRSQESMPGSELSMRCTMGICRRSDGLYIENVGVVPDLPRWITPADLANHFTNYSREVLNTAVQLAEGKSAAEVKKYFFTEQAKKRPTSDQYKEAQKVFDALSANLEKATDSGSVIKSYEDFFSELNKIDRSKLNDSDWAWLSVTLPNSLTKKDMILMSLRRPDEIVDRLKQMRNLSRHANNEEDLKLIDYLINALPNIRKARRPVCFEAMKDLAEYKRSK